MPDRDAASAPQPGKVVFANDLPYTVAEENPLEALKTTLAFSVDDWSSSRAMSWVYGIVLGWDDEHPDDNGAMAEQAERHGWDAAAVERLRRLHAVFVRMVEASK